MLHIVTLFTGFCLIFALATAAWASPQRLISMVIAAGFATAFAVLAGGAVGAFSRAPHLVAAWAIRLPAAIGGALATLRAAVAADVALTPALVRVRAPSLRDRDAFLARLGARSGVVVVEAENETVLLHVLDEGRADADSLSALQKRVAKPGTGS